MLWIGVAIGLAVGCFIGVSFMALFNFSKED